MRLFFLYRASDGAEFALPLEVDEHKPFNVLIWDAEEIAVEVAGGPVTFLTCELPNYPRRGGIQSISEAISPLLARGIANEIARLGSVEKGAR